MQMVYLGLFSKIFDWVFSKILSPVISFIAGLISDVLGALFEYVLEPILMGILFPIVIQIFNIIMEFIGIRFYMTYAVGLKVIDIIQVAFDIFAGVEDVSIGSVKGSLLEVLFQAKQVQVAIWAMISIGFALAILCAIIATVKSMGELGEQKFPVSKVMRMTFKSIGYLILIPFTCLFIIQLSSRVLIEINRAFGDDEVRMSGILFFVASLDASRDGAYNVSGRGEDDIFTLEFDAANGKFVMADMTADGVGGSKIGDADDVRHKFRAGKEGYSCTNLADVDRYFIFGRIDYLIGWMSLIFLVIILLLTLFTFIRRIFEVLLLFLVSPFFAAMMPLDEGEKMKAWQDLFVAKLFSGYGTVIAMQLYFVLIIVLNSSKITYGENVSSEASYLIELLFILGGAWAVYKAGPMVTTLLNQQAGMAEEAANSRVFQAKDQIMGKINEHREKRFNKEKEAKNKMNQEIREKKQAREQGQRDNAIKSQFDTLNKQNKSMMQFIKSQQTKENSTKAALAGGVTSVADKKKPVSNSANTTSKDSTATSKSGKTSSDASVSAQSFEGNLTATSKLGGTNSTVNASTSSNSGKSASGESASEKTASSTSVKAPKVVVPAPKKSDDNK